MSLSLIESGARAALRLLEVNLEAPLFDCCLVGEKQINKSTRSPRKFVLSVSYVQGDICSEAW